VSLVGAVILVAVVSLSAAARRARGLTPMVENVVHFMVVPNSGGTWSVVESGFAKPLAEFSEADTAESTRCGLPKAKWRGKSMSSTPPAACCDVQQRRRRDAQAGPSEDIKEE